MLFTTATARAQLTITVGDHTLLAGQAGQTFTISVTGSSPAVAGLDFYISVGDGTSGPAITGVDLITSTIFSANNSGTGTLLGDSWSRFRAVTTSSGTVSGPGLLATITIDTTGFTSAQTWNLIVSTSLGSASGTTQFYDSGGLDVFPTVVDGTISIVPEPSAGLAVASALLGGAWFIRRRRQA